MAKLGKILMILGSIGTFIFMAACTGGNYWHVTSNSLLDGNQGLWKYCINGICNEYNADIDWLKATKAFAVLAPLAAAASILMAILGMVSDRIKSIFVSLFLFAAAGSMIIALSIYTSKISVGNYSEYGWSYIFGWIGAFGGITGGLLGFFADKF